MQISADITACRFVSTEDFNNGIRLSFYYKVTARFATGLAFVL